MGGNEIEWARKEGVSLALHGRAAALIGKRTPPQQHKHVELGKVTWS